jgi:CelD/BcsL family acetyltransferase involved in cellulose biosynthesis
VRLDAHVLPRQRDVGQDGPTAAILVWNVSHPQGWPGQNAARAMTALESASIDGRESTTATVADCDDWIAPVSSRCLSAMERPRWIDAWFAARRDWSPMTVAVRGRGAPEATAVLAAKREGGRLLVRLPGTVDSFTSGFGVVDPVLADGLASSIAAWLQGTSGPWQAVLGPVPFHDRTVKRLSHHFPDAVFVESAPIPEIHKSDLPSAEAAFDKNMRRGLAKARRRLAADGREYRVAEHVTESEIVPLLPAMEEIYRQRDAAHGIGSQQTDSALALWRSLIAEHLTSGELVLLAAWIENTLAAYLLYLNDPPLVRVLDGRFASRWARYSPGRLLETLLVERMLADRRMGGLSWMTATAPEKLVSITRVSPTTTLVIEQAT